MDSTRYYQEAYEHWTQVEREQAFIRAQHSRRVFLKGTAILAMGGVAALLEACGGGDATPANQSSSGTSATGTAGAAGATGKGEPAVSSPYPLVAKYNWRQLDWKAGPPTVGGTALRPVRPLNNWDLRNIVVSTPNTVFYNGLYRPRGEAGNLDGQEFVRDLAQSEEHNADFTQWVFKIPPDVKFHNVAPVNGRKMTAADVAYSMEMYRTQGLWSGPLKIVDKVVAVDDTTVRFDLKQPYFILPNILSMPYFVMFAKEHFEGPQTRWTQQPIGTGAYVMASSEPGKGFEAVRHPDYWEKDSAGTRLPYIDKLTNTYYSDRSALIAGFRAGKVDETGFSDISEFETVVKDVKDAYYVVSPHWGTYQTTIVPQWKNPTLRDPRVRKALSMGIDRKGIVDRLYKGAGTPAYPMPFDQQGLSQPLTWADMPPTMQYNPTQAKALLSQAGFANGLSLQLLTPTPVSTLFVALQQSWKDAGINVTFDEVDSLVWQNRTAKKDFKDLTTYNGLAGFDADVAVRPLYYPGDPQNVGSVDDPTLTGLLDRVYTTVDATARKQLAKQVNDLVLNEVPVIPVANSHIFTGAHNWLHTFAQSLYTTPDNWSGTVWKYFWLDEKAPNGRGGKKA